MLVIGGAGFIGSHTVDALVGLGHEVVILDTLEPEVHGSDRQAPDYLNPAARLVRGDVRDDAVLGSLIEDAEYVFHLAACTGVGQSMYQIRRYAEVNVGGTAVLLEALVARRHAGRRVVVASSRAVYGEGSHHCDDCGFVTPSTRARAQLERAEWDARCPACGAAATAVPTAESAPLAPGSIYGVTKLAQEQACLVAGAAYGFPVVALRYFNVFGPRQSLRNPYTGVISTFINRLRTGRAPEVYEDGLESRDFVHVSDVVRANILAMERDEAVGRVVNIGSGERVSMLEVARTVAEAMGGPAPVVSGQFRVGDVRHCFAELCLARELLGYESAVSFGDGVKGMVDAMAGDQGDDLWAVAAEELRARGLLSEGRW